MVEEIVQETCSLRVDCKIFINKNLGIEKAGYEAIPQPPNQFLLAILDA